MTTPSEPAASGAFTPSQTAQTPVDPGAIQTTLPPSSTGVQTAESPAGSQPVALPPITAEQRAAEEIARKERLELWLDRALVVLVLGLAFLSASFPIHNSDFLMHLGTGKLLSEGKYPLGEDPFSANTLGVRWVNHSWLLDLLSYG